MISNEDNRLGMFNWYAENILPCGYCIWSYMWGWPKICGLKRIIIFQDNGWFSEKPTRSLNYWVAGLRMSKIYWDWCLLGDELAFRDFGRREFPTFSLGGSVSWNLGKLLEYLVEFVSHKAIFYLLVFIDISNSCFWPCLPIYNLESPKISGLWISCIFTWSEITWITWIDALFLEIILFCYSCKTLICVENHP